MEKYQIWLALGTLTLLFVSALADDVVVLTEDNFEKEVGLDKGALVKFYAPWCGHCEKLAPEYEKLGSSFKKAKSVFVGKVDCDEHKSLCNKYGVSRYPNFQWFPKGSLEPKKYEGPRTAESLAEFVNNEGGNTSAQVENCQMGIQSASQPSSVDSILKEIFHEEGKANWLDSYSAWQAKHPSALEEFECMIAAAKGKNIVVFLDYDGTLSPIVEDPSKAFMSDTMRSAVQEVAHYFPTAIVTGRSLDKVNGFVQLKNVVYAGSHGMDISTPSGSLKHKNHSHENRTVDEQGQEVVLFQPAQEFLPTVQEIIQVLEDKVKNIKGAMVEDNKFCVSVHFRRVAEEDVNTLAEIVNSTVEAYPKFRVSDGKKVMEIRPRINWDKGRALEYLLETFGFNSSTDFLPMYIGDDKTDEDAFKVIRQIGRGYPIVVSSVPRETNASFSLRDPNEVMSFLLRLANWKKKMLH